MTTTIHDEVPQDAARLAELVLNQRETIAALTARLAVVEAKTRGHTALLEAMGDAARFPAWAARRPARARHLSVLPGRAR